MLGSTRSMVYDLEVPMVKGESGYTLRDGTKVVIRELRGEDKGKLERFVDGLSEDALFFRFLSSGIDRQVLIEQLSPRPGGVTLVAMKDGEIVGHIAYFLSGSEAAEVGVLILDRYQGKGLGSRLIERIAQAANAAGISMFETIIDWNNTRMIRMVRNMGFPTSEKVEPDIIRIRFPTSIDPVTLGEFQESWVFTPGC